MGDNTANPSICAHSSIDWNGRPQFEDDQTINIAGKCRTCKSRVAGRFQLENVTVVPEEA